MHNILILTTWEMSDGLIGRYVLPYIPLINRCISEGSRIYLVTYEKEDIKNPNSPSGVEWLPFKYHRFGVLAILYFIKNFFLLYRFIKENNIQEIHPWCSPPGVMGLLLSKATGIDLVLDSFEPHAEPMVESHTWKRNSMAFHILFHFERWMNRSASQIIAANQNMAEYCREKFNFVNPNMFFKPACVDLDDFNPLKRKNPELLSSLNLENKIVAVYAGKFGGSYLEHEIFELVKEAAAQFGDSFRLLLLNNQDLAYIKELSRKAGFNEAFIIQKYIPYSQVPDFMGLGDFGIIPFKPVPSKRYGSPIKTAEYLALGLPVVITKNISNDSQIIKNNNAGYILNNLDISEYRNAVQYIKTVLTKEDEQSRLTRLHTIARKYYSFDIAKSVYEEVYR